MNIRQIEAFRATMRTGSITAAAKLMHITQPSVSRLIADLQTHLGFALFIRSGRGLLATVEARRFYQGVESLFSGTEKLQDLADTIANARGAKVTIGSIQTLATPVVAEVLSTCYLDGSPIRSMSYIANTPDIINAVQIQRCDLGLVSGAQLHGEVEVIFQTQLPYVCLIPRAHPLANEHGALDLQAFADTGTFAIMAHSSAEDALQINPELSAKLTQNGHLFAANMLMMVALARKTQTPAVVDILSAKQAAHLGDMIYRPLIQPCTFPVALITRGLDTLSQDGRQIAQLITDKIQQHQKHF